MYETVAGQTGLRAMLAGWKLPCPNVPVPLADRLAQVTRGVFSTRTRIEVSPYAIDFWVRETQEGEVSSYALVAHAGHGTNSWAIHYFLVIDRLQLFLQVPWGGAYMDRPTTTSAVAEAFRLADQLLGAVAAVPEAAWPGPDSITLMASGFYGSTLTIPGEFDPAQSDNRDNTQRRVPDVFEPLKTALAWVGGLSESLQ